jgi:hypothetical protein
MELLNYKINYTDKPLPPPLEEGDEQLTIEQ